MNIYVLVEGVSVESKVYPHWIKQVNPNLSQIFSIADFKDNNFYLISGGGYPQYFERIREAVEDLNEQERIHRLVISVDAEDMTYADKFSEVDTFVRRCNPIKPYHIVIQNNCFESWCLGNRKNYTRAPQRPRLRSYVNFFDVSTNDPEIMPSMYPDELTRAQFAFRYLSELCQEKGRFYSKANPSYVAHQKFFFHVRKRVQETEHLNSVNAFIDAFS